MEKYQIAAIAILAVSFALSVVTYDAMPDLITTHWNAAGEPDGHMEKVYAAMIMPVISVMLYALFVAVPRIDPLKANIRKFKVHYDRFIILMLGFFLYMNVITTALNLGVQLNIGMLMMPAMGVLFYFIGTLLNHVKRNWFIGIRTPWTMSSDVVWKKTHMFGAKMFKAIGMLAFLGIALPEVGLVLVVVMALVAAAATVAYSYAAYRKIKS